MARLKAVLLDGPEPGVEIEVESRLTNTVEGFRDRLPFLIEQWYGVEAPGGIEVVEYILVVPSPIENKNCYKVKRS